MSKLDELIVELTPTESVEQRREKAKNRIYNALDTIYEEIPDLKLIRVVGYTPGYNDGDPCVHEQSVAVDVYNPDYLFDEFFRDDADKQERAIAYDPNLALLSSREEFKYSDEIWVDRQRVPNPVLPEDPYHALLVKAYRLMTALKDDLYVIYDSHWQIDIIRDETQDCGYRVEKSDYDCGY